MTQALRISTLSGLFLVCLLGFQNCSKVAFTTDEASLATVKSDATGNSKNNTNSSGDDTACRVDLIASTKNVKVLFLIDTSGSNADSSGGAGTDPGKTWRLNTVNSFISAYGNKPNFEFTFATFQNSSAKALLTNSSGQGIFSKNMNDINQAIADFKNTKDAGYTPYDAALALVSNIIAYDQSVTTTKDAGYVVIMVSDGTPTNSSYTDKNGMINLTNDVNAILAQAPGQVSLNTVYLYNKSAPTASDKAYLQKISSLGSGAFIEASSNETLQISDTVQVPKTVCN
jgi:uncharacterized protein YegL